MRTVEGGMKGSERKERSTVHVGHGGSQSLKGWELVDGFPACFG
jgi:hypothetical protein